MVCWYWNHTSCSDFLVTILKASLSFSFISILLHPFFTFFFFFKSATYKECELPSAQTKQRLDQMWPAICWMGNKRKEWSHLPSVDAESSRACLAFQQGFPRWEIDKGKASASFSPCPDLTAPLSKVERKRGLLAMKKWELISKGWSSINKLSFALNALPWPLLSGIEHLISAVVRKTAERQIPLFPISVFSAFYPWMPHKRLLGELKVMRQVLVADTNKRKDFSWMRSPGLTWSETIWFTFSEGDGCNRTSGPGDIDMLTWTLLSPSLIVWTVLFHSNTWHRDSNFLPGCKLLLKVSPDHQIALWWVKQSPQSHEDFCLTKHVF